MPITAGVPQESVLGPLLFLLYINDLCDDIESVIYLFTDDCSLFQKIDKNYHKYVNTLNRLEKNIKVVQTYALLLPILSSCHNFHSLEVVDRVSETQFQVGEN